MKDDPAIAALRKVRHRISESVGHDAKKLVDYYRKLQERHKDRLASDSTAQPASSEVAQD